MTMPGFVISSATYFGADRVLRFVSFTTCLGAAATGSTTPTVRPHEGPE